MLDKQQRDIDYCAFCPKLCRFACPAAQAQSSETVTPWGKMTALRLVRSGGYPMNEEVGGLVYQCVECRACQTFCKHEIAVSETMEPARQYAVESGVAPQRAVNFLDSYREHGNPYRRDLSQLLQDAGGSRPRSPEGKTLYFIGCTTLVHRPELAREALAVLDALGVRFDVYLDDAVCCGAPALNMGGRELFLEQARAVTRVLNRYDEVISGCPGCIMTFKQSYPRYGIRVRPRLRHITEVMDQAAAEGRFPVRRKLEGRLMYHDSCHLGRYLGVYDEPRRVLAALAAEPVLEFSWNRAASNCCGGGGGYSIVNLKSASAITQNRLVEFHESDADTLAVACPSCLKVLARGDQNLDVRDLISLAAGCL